MLGETNVGGGANLNFKVVGGTTQPSNPSENTIWVNTDVEITEWHIGDYSNPNWTEQEGKVFIHAEATGGSGVGVSFNAIKKNGLWINPLKVTQYANGVWVQKSAFIYKSGAWVEWWDGTLYANGDDYTFITGGWITYNPAPNTTNFTYSKGTCTVAEQYFRLKTVPVQGIARQTVNKIDLTSVNSIEVEIVQSGTFNWSQMYVFVSEVSGTKQTVDVSAKFLASGTTGLSTDHRTVSLDVSALSGDYYVCVGQQTYDGSAGLTTDVYSIKLV